MGSLQSTISPEQVAMGSGVVVTAAVGYLFYAANPPATESENSSKPETSASAASKKGKKKKTSKNTAAASPSTRAGDVTPPMLQASSNLFSTSKLDTALSEVESKASKNKKKNKSKAKSEASGEKSAQESALDTDDGGFQSEPTPGPSTPAAEDSSSETSAKDKKKKKKKVQVKSPLSQSVTSPSADAAPSPNTPPPASTFKSDIGSPWTRVESKRGKPKPAVTQGTGAVESSSHDDAPEGGSDAGVTTSVTDEDQEEADLSAAEKPRDNVRTLAEKMLPKPRKTGVADMLETPDYPEIARVMRVTNPAQQIPPGVSIGDYEDADEMGDGDNEEDDGWGIVKSRKPRSTRPLNADSPSASTASLSTTDPSKLTKHQKQNIVKREATKQAKADAEADRLARLAQHKKELEKVRIAELYKGKGKKEVGGGMSSSVQGGSLVWE